MEVGGRKGVTLGLQVLDAGTWEEEQVWGRRRWGSKRRCPRGSGLDAADSSCRGLPRLEDEPRKDLAPCEERAVECGERRLRTRPEERQHLGLWETCSQRRLKRRERKPGGRAVGSHTEPVPSPFLAPSSPPIQFPFHFATAARALDLSKGDGTTAS